MTRTMAAAAIQAACCRDLAAGWSWVFMGDWGSLVRSVG
jgi:hypothetical protein